MDSGSRRQRGFTIVELLVTIGVITILAGILLPALSGVQRRAAKSEEANRLRQVGVAWNLYSISNQDHALPGYLTQGVLDHWDVQYELPVKRLNTIGGGVQTMEYVEPVDAGPWTWRLLSYLDYNQETVLGHRNYADMSPESMCDYTNESQELEDLYGYTGLYKRRPTEVAFLPTFSYNAIYIGGWWQMDTGGQDIARPRYATRNVVCRSPSQIRNTTDMVVFCTGAEKPVGSYSELRNEEPGSHYVVPPILANERIWQQDTTIGSPEIIEVEREDPVPLGRYTGAVSVLFGDLRVEATEPGNLDNQRHWLNTATERTDSHDP